MKKVPKGKLITTDTLRKAIAYGKLVEGVDVCKFGKQWVVSMVAMKREYGEPRIYAGRAGKIRSAQKTACPLPYTPVRPPSLWKFKDH